MNKTVLIIGYGSIGKRHARLLKKFKNISKIHILTKQNCGNFNRIKLYSNNKSFYFDAKHSGNNFVKPPGLCS